MNNKELNEEKDWFGDLLSSVDDPEIGTDENALLSHDMSSLEDMELERIIQEAKSGDWKLTEEDQVYLTNTLPKEEMVSEETVEEEFQDAEFDDDLEDSDEEELDDWEEEEDEEEDDEPEIPERVPRKVRPKRKNGYGLFGLPHLTSMAIWAALCIFIGISLGRFVWICASDILAFGRVERDVVVTITAEDTVDSVADRLSDEGLINYPSLFKLYCQLAKAEVGGKISTGTFTLNTLYDYHALVSGMSSTSSYRETIKVVIPEGYTCAQIFKLLEEKGVCTAEKLENYCIESEFSSYWFLEGVQKGTKYCLEGFLYPDTYQFYTDSTPQQVFIKLLNRFDDIFDEEMQIALNTLNSNLAEMYKSHGYTQSFINERLLTVKDLITVASIIEKETAYSGESQNIASVIYNRLTNPGEYPKLNIDATIVYALGGKTDLTAEDMAFDSPYNTYLYEGLPPGPISNPGLYSLKAALLPTQTKYHFYALDTSGEANVHRFFETYEEHLDFIQGRG